VRTALQVLELLRLARAGDRQLAEAVVRARGAQLGRDGLATALEEVKAARHNCTAWVLGIFALELLEVGSCDAFI